MRTPSRSRPTSLYRYTPLVAALAGVLAQQAIAACVPQTTTPPNLVYCVTNANAAGPGSLAQALSDIANTSWCTSAPPQPALTPTIGFNITGTGPFTISPASTLTLSCGVTSVNATLDGTSQTGYVPNSSTNGFNAQNQIVVNGSSMLGFTGLVVNDLGYGASLTIKGVDFANFQYGGNGTALSGPINLYGSRISNSTLGVVSEGYDPDGFFGPSGIVRAKIGGPSAAQRNVFVGNVNAHVAICCENTDVDVVNNFIGTADGVTAAGGGKGVHISTASNISISDNLISGNTAAGIVVQFGNNVSIQNNKIGTRADGFNPLGNTGAGIHVDGGFPVTVSNNTIAFNSADGFVLMSGSGNTLQGNRIFSNGGKAINLGGVAAQVPNDPDGTDDDTGANGLQNFPVISSAIKDAAANTTTVNWSFNGDFSSSFGIEFFSNPAAAATPQATNPIGSTSASTGATSHFMSGSTPISGLHDFITATATHLALGNTSELGATALAKGLALAPTSIDFGNVVVNATSGNQVATLTSIGAASTTINFLHGSSLCYGGPPAPPPICSGSQFNCSTTCVVPQTLATSASCAVTSSFAPIALGPQSTTIYICDDAGGNPRTLTLIGNGVPPPPATISPPSHDFGSTVVNAISPSQGFTVSNPGPLSITLTPFSVTPPFQIISNTCGPSLAPAAACAVVVEYAPTALGPSSGSVASTASSGGVSAALAGTGVPPPPATIAPPTHNFGAVEAGGFSANQAFTVTNPGPLTISLTPFAASAPFQIVTNSCGATLAATATCSVTARYAPVAVGASTGTLSTTASSGGASSSLSGTGTAGPPPSLSPPSVDFGTVSVGTSSATTQFTLSNPALTPVPLSAITVNPPFSLFGTTCLSILPAGSSCTASVKFSPTAVGPAAGAVSVTAGGINLASGLTGTGSSLPLLQIAPPAFDFGTISVGNSSGNKTFTISNPASVSTSLTTPAVNSPFQVVSTTCGSALAGSSSCDAVVRFTPISHGAASGFLVVNSSAGSSSATLSGFGLRQPAVSLPGAPIEFGSMIVGSAPVQQTIALTSSGNSILGINSVTVSPPFTLSNGCGVSLAEGDSCNITVGFNPTAVGDFAGFLGVSTNAPNASFIQVPVHAAVQKRPEPIIRVSPRVINFGARFAGSPSQSQNVTITNEGGSIATLVLTLNMPHFSLVNTSCGPTLAPAASCNVELAFLPQGFGPRRASLVVESNAPDAPRIEVSLSGAGCRPPSAGQSRGGGSINCSP